MNELQAKVFNSLDEARAFAWSKSIFSDFFYRVIYSTSGKYLVDWLGFGDYSGEQTIEIYHKGELA